MTQTEDEAILKEKLHKILHEYRQSCFELAISGLHDTEEYIGQLLRLIVDNRIDELERLVNEHGYTELEDNGWLEITHNSIRNRIAALKAQEGKS